MRQEKTSDPPSGSKLKKNSAKKQAKHSSIAKKMVKSLNMAVKEDYPVL